MRKQEQAHEWWGKLLRRKKTSDLVKRNDPEMDLWVKMNEFRCAELDIHATHPEADHYFYLVFEGETGTSVYIFVPGSQSSHKHISTMRHRTVP